MSRLTRLKDVSSTAMLFDRQYGYNNASQINQITEPTNTRSFGYDLVNRLTGVTASNNQNESYNFDDVGNRTSSHRSANYGYQPFNRVVSTATANYNYDANGNMVSKGEGANFWRYGYDYENRLVSASTRKQTVRYRYDALGRRVQRYTVGTKETTKFIYDGQDVLVDDNAGTLTKYLNGLGIDNKLKISINGTTKYFIADHLGSTNALTDSSGAILEQTAYDSFGNATNNLSTRYQFTGREFDNFSGLHYYRARFYDANLGRFISEDPIGFAGGDVNLFGYVRNNPLNLIDPKGNVALPFIGLFWKYPPEECDEACQRDRAKMEKTFDSVVNEMNENGERHWFYYWNGIQGSMTIFTGDKPYLSCVDQAERLKKRLEKDTYEGDWKFHYESSVIPGTDWKPHTRVLAKPSNPRVPEVVLDPWKNQKGRGNFIIL